MRFDVTDEQPPEGLVFDDRAPCYTPPGPGWAQGVGSMPQGEDEDGAYCILPSDLEPSPRTSRAFAVGADRPLWPLKVRPMDEKKVRVAYQDVHKRFRGQWGRHFGSGRKNEDGTSRFHAGIDLAAVPGDVVQAMEDGQVVAILPFHLGSWAIYIRHDSGLLVNYGEVEKGSWDVKVGDDVTAGQPIARIGTMYGGSSMLHLETFAGDTPIASIREGEMQWSADEPAPESLLDPSKYLVQAQRNWFDTHA